jgi:hypothetical protein
MAGAVEVPNLRFYSSLARVSAAVLVADGGKNGAIDDARRSCVC